MHTMHEQASKAISHKSKTHAHLACHLLVAVSSKADLTMHSRFTLFELDIESSKYPLASMIQAAVDAKTAVQHKTQTADS